MHFNCEKATAIFGRPVIAEINHHADMRVTAAIRVRLAVARIPPAHCGVEVPMVRVLIDHRIHARVWINRMWPDEVLAGKVMPKMTVDGVDEKKLAVFVPVMAPRIRGAATERFHDLALRMVTPHRPAHRDALFGGRARRAEFARTRRAAAPVEPAVRTKPQPVGEIVVVLRWDGESVEDDFGCAVRHIITVAVRNEQDLWGAHRPHAAMAHFNAGEHLHFVGENLARIEMAIAVLVFEDEDKITQVEDEFLGAFGVSVVLSQPHRQARAYGNSVYVL